MINEDILNFIENDLYQKYGHKIEITGQQSVSGGSINASYKLNTQSGNFFAKLNDAGAYPGMFEKEKKGLELLKGAGELFIPKVISTGEVGTQSYILMEHVDSDVSHPSFWSEFGKSLARLHKHSNEEFGLDHDNYIGSLPQYNDSRETWTAFFAEMRLGVQCKMARDSGKIDGTVVSNFEKLYPSLENLFPEEKPALIHGDLWSGNFMVGPDGGPCIIDPAVYYGHREMDLGMSALFGGFDRQFYLSYHEEYSLEKGWEERLDLANLYPLMVHVNLFGGGYLGQVKNILKKFV